MGQKVPAAHNSETGINMKLGGIVEKRKFINLV